MSEMSTPNSRAPISPLLKGPKTESERKRKVLSCFNCHRRKLRCGREYPTCSRCQKAGHANTCFYDERLRQPKRMVSSVPQPLRPNSPTKQLAPSNGPFINPAAHLRQSNRIENRLLALEPCQTSSSGIRQVLGEYLSPSRAEKPPAVEVALEPTLSEAITFKGNNFKTQYYGSTSPTSTIAHFPELRVFMKEAISHNTSLPRVQRDLKKLQIRWKDARTNLLPSTDSELVHFLPERETVDDLVRLYFDTFETMYRILHFPSFWKEYQMFWDNPQVANPPIVVLILLVMATVSCLSVKEQPKYIGDSSIARERAVMWIEVSEWWLRRHSQKNLFLATWQVRCLLTLAKQVNLVKKKQAWTAAGTLVREAMSAGFHRDPSILGEKVSLFNQEMRRRLWATMVELELQAAIDRGMPSALVSINFDCATVLNVNDEDLGVECDSLPTSRPLGEYTACSFLCISKLSFSLRVTLSSLLNDLSASLPYNEVWKYEEIIRNELEKISPQAEGAENQGIQGLPPMARILLDIQLRQFFILLHAPFAREAKNNTQFLPSMMVCFNAAASILEQHSQVTSSGNFLLLLLRHDYVRAALVICHNMFISLSIKNNYFNSNSNAFIQYAENTLTLLGNRIARLATGQIQYWYISAACALIRSKMLPQESAAQRQQATDRVTRQYYVVLASQEDCLKAKDLIIPAHLNKTSVVGDQLQIYGNMTTAPRASFPDVTLSQPAVEQDELPLEDFYFNDPAAWTFENFWAIE
ncbi:hypothetical protein K432DRAFT_428448 [Lepidopterella palustris CBS 459.81]|uniref:Zn(2)-C6 fungal-type domain-containing protein n=1 Tax=Lepidopterella palustris CBS 459.81 TaxID=1314670 RepID=A0A8E2E3S0_9PEZI|nr:hypothetical protein K432DRAFT_428448 [Lepidopterella palustris CBS 459.81]